MEGFGEEWGGDGDGGRRALELVVGLVVVVHTPRLLPTRVNVASFHVGHSLQVLTLATWALPFTRESSGMAMACVPLACLAGERIISAMSGASAMLQLFKTSL